MQDLKLLTNGFSILNQTVAPEAIEHLRHVFANTFEEDRDGNLARSSQGHVYAARNLVRSIPEVRSVWKEHGLSEYLRTELGSDFGLVRALFFDKPPGKTWSLSWHKDLSIAVQDNSIASNFFNRPTNKLGVPHVIASDAILQSMLTLRIHLDRTSVENGALKVVPESHLSSVSEGVGCEHSVLIEADAGEVLAMRPLTTHSSGASHSNTAQHRRILHLEFASSRSLPDGYQWYDFVSGS